MNRSPRSIYRDHDLTRDARPRPAMGTSPPVLRLVPAVEPRAAAKPVAAEQVVVPRVAARPPAAEALEPRDREILAVLERPATFGESADALFRRKERELGALFATLSVCESVALAKRLSAAAPGDIVSARFSRLVAERQQRLIAFLEDAKRREAVENARAPRAKGSTR